MKSFGSIILEVLSIVLDFNTLRGLGDRGLLGDVTSLEREELGCLDEGERPPSDLLEREY